MKLPFFCCVPFGERHYILNGAVCGFAGGTAYAVIVNVIRFWLGG